MPGKRAASLIDSLDSQLSPFVLCRKALIRHPLAFLLLSSSTGPLLRRVIMRKKYSHRAVSVLLFAGVLSIIFIFLPSFSTAQTEQIRLAWDRNTEPDIAGYKVYYGNVSRSVNGGYQYFIDVTGNPQSPTCTLTLDVGKTYYIAVTAYDSSDNESGYSVELRRQSYVDVPPANWAYDFVMSISDGGISVGCREDDPATPANEAIFCGDYPITRGEMAVFVETSLGHPPNACTNRFADVRAGNPFCGYVERLADDGITGGCGGNNFCPNAPVTRGEMAVFIEAALGNNPVQCSNQFTDVPLNNIFCGFIERLADDGITGGCTAQNFCPNNAVSRSQMAVFLVAAPDPLYP